MSIAECVVTNPGNPLLQTTEGLWRVVALPRMSISAMEMVAAVTLVSDRNAWIMPLPADKQTRVLAHFLFFKKKKKN